MGVLTGSGMERSVEKKRETRRKTKALCAVSQDLQQE